MNSFNAIAVKYVAIKAEPSSAPAPPNIAGLSDPKSAFSEALVVVCAAKVRLGPEVGGRRSEVRG